MWDYTLIIGNIQNNDCKPCFSAFDQCIFWCKHNKLLLNENKTKELTFDFRRSKSLQQNAIINNVEVEIVNSLKYLGCVVDNKLTLEKQAKCVLKKSAQRRFLV